MINNSYLLGLYGGTSTTSPYLGASVSAKKKQPTAPWAASQAANQPKVSDMVRSALAGRKFINETAVKLDQKSASADYQKLFAIYQGLNTLSALADYAGEKGRTDSQLSQANRRFEAGLVEINDYLKTSKLKDVSLIPGTTQSTVKTSAGVERDARALKTGAIHSGNLGDPVAAYQGDVRFSLTSTVAGSSRTVDFDLDEMGATPRTMDNVISYLNGKLEAAGVTSRVSRETFKGEPRTIKVGEKDVTLPAGADSYGMKFSSSASETIAFSAPAVSDAVYVTQGMGKDGKAQLIKFQADGGNAADPVRGVTDARWTPGQAGSTDLPEGVEAIRASAVAADGSVWLVADLTTGSDSQPIKGARDVALMKYDSVGNLVQTTTLGAATNANGFSIAIGDDGRVALAGSVIGVLEPGQAGANPAKADSFVTVFNSDGDELWTQRRGAREADEATEVRFGANGQVYVAGRAQSAMSGASAVGGWDSYLQTFQQSTAPVSGKVTALSAGTIQFGTTGDDTVQAMTVSGSNLYTAGVENGRAVVRQFTLDANGVPTLSSSRDMGVISGGISGIAVENGQVVVVGTNSRSSMDVANATNAHGGGSEIFIATLDAGLQASANERLTFYGGVGEQAASDVEIRNGKVWITGTTREDGHVRPEDPTKGFLTRVDLATGVVELEKTWAGLDNQVKPTTLSFSAGAASVLDRLGLPMGEVDKTQSKQLTTATGLRAGEQFTISQIGRGRAVTVTIEPKDTLETLARKINSASNRQLEAKVVQDNTTDPPVQRLQITAARNRQGAVISSGPAGKDALAGLGISPGLIGRTAEAGTKTTFGLNLPSSLNLNSADSVKAAIDALASAMTQVRSAYRALDPSQTDAGATPKTGNRGRSQGSVTYYQNQLANYQAALNRLTG